MFSIVLGAALFIYLYWRLSGAHIAAWLTTGLIVLAAPNLILSGLVIANPAAAEVDPLGPLAVQLMILASLLAIAIVADHTELRVDPLVAGLLLGSTLGAVTLALSVSAPQAAPAMALVVLGLMSTLVAAAVAWFLLSQTTLPPWGRLRLALGMMLLTVAGFAAHAPSEAPAVIAFELLTLVAGAVLLCCTSLALARLSIRDNRRTVEILNDRLARAEARSRTDRARLHEIGATVAGIASATRLIHDHPVVIPLQRRSELEQMMEAEVARLERLMLGESIGQRVFGLDDMVGQLVVSQHAQGRRVTWLPTGHRVKGCPDDLAEIVNVLLDNAAKHGHNTGATVEVHSIDGVVEIAVSDSGPGVPPAVRQQLFEWGSRGPDSAGQGIGLHIARTLAEKQGGYLMLEDSPGPGTTFVVGLLTGERHDAVSHIAG